MTVKNFSSVLLKSISLLMLAVFTFSSCNKDDNDEPSSQPIEGTYVGKYGFDNDTPDTDFKFKVKSGGAFEEIGTNSGAVTGQGTWQLVGNTITAHYTMVFSPFNQYSVSGTFDATTGKIIGTWGYDNDATDGGKMDMTKQ